MAHQAWLYVAEALEAVGRRDEAREALANLNPAWQGPKVRVDRLIKVSDSNSPCYGFCRAKIASRP